MKTGAIGAIGAAGAAGTTGKPIGSARNHLIGSARNHHIGSDRNHLSVDAEHPDRFSRASGTPYFTMDHETNIVHHNQHQIPAATTDIAVDGAYCTIARAAAC